MSVGGEVINYGSDLYRFHDCVWVPLGHCCTCRQW